MIIGVYITIFEMVSDADYGEMLDIYVVLIIY